MGGFSRRRISLVILTVTWASIILATQQQDCPEKCSCSANMTTVKCSHIGQLPAEMSHFPALKTLILRDVTVNELREDFFDPLPSRDLLEHLRLSGNFENISNDTLSGMTSLRGLDISGSFMTSWDAANLFIGLVNATRLNVLIADNVFTDGMESSIDNDFFSPLSALHALYFRGNSRAFNGILKHHLFQSLWDLTGLFLDECGLTEIHNSAFRGLDNLRALSLKGNLLSCYSKHACGFLSEYHLASLTSLDMSYNDLDIYKHNLFFHGGNLPELLHLTLSDNRLSSIPSGMFHKLSSLQTLDLSSNLISSIEPGAFDDLIGLLHLHLNQTVALTELGPRLFQGCSSLETLDLSACDIGSIDNSTFAGLQSLRYLNLRGNYFHDYSSLHTVFLNSSQLYKLDLGETQLTSIPEFVASLENLSELFLDKNYLTDDAFKSLSGISSLETLDMSYNSFTRIQPSFVLANPSLRMVLLEANPFVCDCNFPELGGLINRMNITILRPEAHVCVSPPDVVGRNIFTIAPSKWECHNKQVVVPIICVLVTGLVILLVMVGIRRTNCSHMKACYGRVFYSHISEPTEMYLQDCD